MLRKYRLYLKNIRLNIYLFLIKHFLKFLFNFYPTWCSEQKTSQSLVSVSVCLSVNTIVALFWGCGIHLPPLASVCARVCVRESFIWMCSTSCPPLLKSLCNWLVLTCVSTRGRRLSANVTETCHFTCWWTIMRVIMLQHPESQWVILSVEVTDTKGQIGNDLLFIGMQFRYSR